MSRLAINYTERHKHAFEEIIEYYKDLRVSHGTNQGVDYERMAENTGPKDGKNTKMVRPTTSDFLCDVELAAKRALSAPLYTEFQAVFIDQIISFDILPAEDRATIVDQVGKMLLHRQICPMSIYFRGKDLR